MQTRRLRLGDVVDDYCPRERRLSNHVVVAMVEDAIKQTRCTTCDFEHPYKDGKLPARRKKKDATEELYQQVLEGMTEKPPSAPESSSPEARIEAPPERPAVLAMAAGASTPVAVPAAAVPRPAASNLRTRSTRTKAAAATAPAPAPTVIAAPAAAAPVAPPVTTPSPAPAPVPAARVAPSNGEPPRLAPSPASAATAAASVAASQPVPGDQADQIGDDDAQPVGENEPLHRRTLIRAQLPRPVGEVPTRQAPTFTIREAARAPKFRRPFARNARPQGGQNGAAGPRNGPQPRGGKKGGAPQGAHRFGSGQGPGGHHAKGRQGNQGNKRFK